MGHPQAGSSDPQGLGARPAPPLAALHSFYLPVSAPSLTTRSSLSLRWEGLVLIVLYVFYILIMK